MTERLIQSVPNSELQSYYEAGWAYLMPDFDKPNHFKVEWLSDKLPVSPNRIPVASPNKVEHHERAGS